MDKQEKLFRMFIIGFFLLSILFAFWGASQADAAPVSNIFRNILPETTDTYDIGSTSPAAIWKNVFTSSASTSALIISTINTSGAVRCLQITAGGAVQVASAGCLIIGNVSQSKWATSTIDATAIQPAGAITVLVTNFNASASSSISSNFKVEGASVASSTFQATGNSIFYGSLGLNGSTTPGASLGVQGGIITGSFLNAGNIRATGTVIADDTVTLNTLGGVLGGTLLCRNASLQIAACTTGASGSGWTDDGTIVRLTAITDQVGIGTTTPGADFKLGVQGNVLVSGTTSLANLVATGTMMFQNRVIIATSTTDQADATSDALTVQGGTSAWDGAVRLRFFAADPAGYIGTFTNHPLNFRTNDTDRMVLSSSGRLGIATTSPGFALSVVGELAVATTSSGGSKYGVLRTDSANARVLINANNNATAAVGISGTLSVMGAGTTTGAGFVFSTIENARRLTIQDNNHINFSGVVPTASSCGTGPSFDTGANDVGGKIYIGTGITTSCVVTFHQAWSRAPTCFTNDESNVLLVRNITTQTTMTLDVATSFGGDTIAYSCISKI